MTEKKNIDRLFQEKFKDFEVTPDEKVWENIEAELKEKKKRRVIPFWFRLAGAAAILILGGLLLYKMTAKSGNEAQGEIVNGGKVPMENTVPNTGSPMENPAIENRSVQPNANDAVASENTSENQSDENGGKNDSDNSNPSNPTQKSSGNDDFIKTNRIKSSNAVAGSENSSVKKQPGKATNRENLRLENNAANPGSENAVADKPKNKNNAGRKSGNTDLETLSASAVATSEKKNNSNDDVKLPQSEKKTDSRKTTETRLAEQKNPVDSTQENNNPGKSITGNPVGKNTGIAENTDIKKDSTAIATVAPNALEELLNEKENNVTAKEQKVNRWQITSNVAPIYFSSTSGGSPLDERFQSNKKTYAPSVSYGVGAKFALGKKFFIKSGINSVSLEYNTTDVIFFQTENARRIKNVTPNVQGSLIQIDGGPVATVSNLGRSTIRQFSGDLNQRISYVEVPMEMSYQLVSRKFGVELIGGWSTLILNNNEVSLVSSGMDMNIGEANNLNSLHFSTNVGVGFSYNFLKRFEANFEPMFKYQINTFSNDAGNFKPYFFGLYTGVSYRF